MKVAIAALTVTVPDTVVPADSLNVVSFTFLTDSLNVEVTVVLMETPVVPFTGLVPVTAGAILSRPRTLARVS